ncbi:hypothetical protein CDD80_7310 [Ophiocordyceps camponoti-rufipedis]|uniref:Chromo domain-containing protein n=1 Tax=Ophiocordyceps camponoti-rufipedis TaxID=2004952 RepID=A0A2C5ZLR3_9HYPO|nr:hypothetical protein CDD80_7310 [Ophiocordyceps camponoti-rufipedis]
MSLSQIASAFIGRETMVRLDEVDDEPHADIENDVTGDDLLDWEFIEGNDDSAGNSKTSTGDHDEGGANDVRKFRGVTRETSASASDRQKSRREVSQAKASGGIRGKPGRPKGSKKDKPAKGARRLSGRTRTTPTPFKPELDMPKRKRRVAAKATKPERISSTEYEIESIVDDRIEQDTLRHFYLVKWKGFGSKNNTWEPKTNMAHCSEALMEYEKRPKAKRGKDD